MDLYTIFQGGYTENKWRLLGEYLKGREITAGEGIRIDDSSSSGTLISAPAKREIKQSQPPPFSIRSLRAVPESDPPQYAAELQEGWVIERDTLQGNDGVVFHEVNINAVPMSTRPREEITLEDGDFVMVNFDTDSEGHVTGDPTIIVGSEQTSNHHQPPSGEGAGYGGSYYVKILKFDINEGAPVFTVYQQSDIEHPRLWTGQNVGGARYIHKEWDGTTDTYDFRTLKQIEPSGRTFGKVIVDAQGAEFDDVNDSIKFSAIAERLSSPQINVDDDGAGTITIEGNNNSGSLVWEYCEENESGETQETILTWDDGLITSANASFKAGCAGLPNGYEGDILYHNGTDWVVLPNPGGNPNGEFHVLTHTGINPEWRPSDGNSF